MIPRVVAGRRSSRLRSNIAKPIACHRPERARCLHRRSGLPPRTGSATYTFACACMCNRRMYFAASCERPDEASRRHGPCRSCIGGRQPLNLLDLTETSLVAPWTQKTLVDASQFDENGLKNRLPSLRFCSRTPLIPAYPHQPPHRENDQKNQHYPPESAVIGQWEIALKHGPAIDGRRAQKTCQVTKSKCQARKSKQVSLSA